MTRLRYVLLAALLLGVLGRCQSQSSQDIASDTSDAPSPEQTLTGASPEDIPEPDSATAARFEETMQFAKAQKLHERPIGEIMQTIGLRYRGSPYFVGPLDQTMEETLVCRLDAFDCFTFNEAVLALARGIKQQDYSYEGYARRTRTQRYRGDKVGSYCDRLHYYSEWIYDNEQDGVVEDITRQIGGQRLPKTFSFMTEHRDSYPQLESDSLFQCIQRVEDRINEQITVYHIPQDSIHAVYDDMQAGDLIATSTDIPGLDVTHTGLVYKSAEGDSTGLLHASTSGGVKVSPDLQRYVQDIEKQIGIIVARPQHPGS